MTDECDRWSIESSERLDVRWYRIRMHGEDWLVDYSNPRDLRLYAPDLFLVLPSLVLVSDRFIAFSPLLLGWRYRVETVPESSPSHRGPGCGISCA